VFNSENPFSDRQYSVYERIFIQSRVVRNTFAHLLNITSRNWGDIQQFLSHFHAAMLEGVVGNCRNVDEITHRKEISLANVSFPKNNSRGKR
jgi:hypothetical protein